MFAPPTVHNISWFNLTIFADQIVLQSGKITDIENRRKRVIVPYRREEAGFRDVFTADVGQPFDRLNCLCPVCLTVGRRFLIGRFWGCAHIWPVVCGLQPHWCIAAAWCYVCVLDCSGVFWGMLSYWLRGQDLNL